MEETCPICGKTCALPGVLTDWYWVRKGGVGHWFCSFPCVCASELRFNPYTKYTPTPEEEERMGQ